MGLKYKVIPHPDSSSSWVIIHKDQPIADIEQVEGAPEKPKGFFNRLFKTPQNTVGFKVTNLLGASNKTFLTQASAAKHAVQHHSAGKHLKVAHPSEAIRHHMHGLKNALWMAASDPRMKNEDQEHLLGLSMHHAKFVKKFKTRYKE